MCVSSPGDVQEERDVLEDVVASINRTDGDRSGYRLELFRWEDDVVPQIGPAPQDVDLGEVFRKAAEFDQRGIVLLGEPGSGKTTGARQLAWKLASRHSRPEDLGLPPGITPVLLRFRNLSRRALTDKNGLRTFLDEATHCSEAPDDCQSPGEALWNRKDGGLLWILDGLDEVVDPDARQKVSGWIQRAIKHRPDDWFLVTCRRETRPQLGSRPPSAAAGKIGQLAQRAAERERSGESPDAGMVRVDVLQHAQPTFGGFEIAAGQPELDVGQTQRRELGVVQPL